MLLVKNDYDNKFINYSEGSDFFPNCTSSNVWHYQGGGLPFTVALANNNDGVYSTHSLLFDFIGIDNETFWVQKCVFRLIHLFKHMF